VNEFVTESGPEARATSARLREHRYVFQGEGFTVSSGLDGPTACVVAEGGTLVGMLNEEDVDETDWRRSTTVRRFATAEARDWYLATQPWQAEVQLRGWAVKREGMAQRSESGAIDLRLYAGISNSEVTVRAGIEDEKGGGKVTIVCATVLGSTIASASRSMSGRASKRNFACSMLGVGSSTPPTRWTG
jgi:hypothetical protein